MSLVLLQQLENMDMFRIHSNSLHMGNSLDRIALKLPISSVLTEVRLRDASQGNLHLLTHRDRLMYYWPLQVKHFTWKWLAWTRSTSPLHGFPHLKHWMHRPPAEGLALPPSEVGSTMGERKWISRLFGYQQSLFAISTLCKISFLNYYLYVSCKTCLLNCQSACIQNISASFNI